MKQECIDSLDHIIKKEIIADNKLVTVDEIQQKLHAIFCIEYSKEEIKKILLKETDIFEIKENSFVCKTYFLQFVKTIKDKENIVNKINRHYFIRLSESEASRLLNGKNELNILEEKKEVKIFNAYEELGTHKIKYTDDETEKLVIDFILKSETSLRFNYIAENLTVARREVEEILKFDPYLLSKKLIKNNKLFYIASNKNIFFKPLLIALIINKKTKLVSYSAIGTLLRNKLKSQSINRKELMNCLKENNKFFNIKEKSIEILCTLEEYIESTKKEYNVEKNSESNKKVFEPKVSKDNSLEKVSDKIVTTEKSNKIEKNVKTIFETEKRDLKTKELVHLYNVYYNKTINENTLNNILESSNKFTRVFVGVYRLNKAHGEKHIYTGYLAREYLREKRKPSSMEEILDNVSGKTKASRQTIKTLTLVSNETFPYSSGVLALKEWTNDYELSKKYYISKNRIEATKSNFVDSYNKGSFIKNGKLVTLHCFNKKSIIENYGLKLSEDFSYELSYEIFLRYKNLEYELKILDNNEGILIEGILGCLENIGLEDGMYFYLVYLNKKTIRVYTWDEFENEIFCNEDNIIKVPTINYMEVNENISPINSNKENYEIEEGQWKYEMLLKEGLRTGQVKSEWIESIDFDEETDVKDYYEVQEELEEKGIMII